MWCEAASIGFVAFGDCPLLVFAAFFSFFLSFFGFFGALLLLA